MSRASRLYASSAVPVSLSQLVGRSDHILVGTPRKGEGLWEPTELGTRIVTYTEVEVDHALDGRATSKRVTVRTLGGRVGEIGQLVSGEAELQLNRKAVLFLAHTGLVRGADPVLGVSAMAQGHYPLLADAAGTSRLLVSPRLARLVEPGELTHGFETALSLPRGAAVEALRDRTLSECEELIARELFGAAGGRR